VLAGDRLVGVADADPQRVVHVLQRVLDRGPRRSRYLQHLQGVDPVVAVVVAEAHRHVPEDAVALLGAEVIGDLFGNHQGPVGLDLQVHPIVEELLGRLGPGRSGEDSQRQPRGHKDRRQRTR